MKTTDPDDPVEPKVNISVSGVVLHVCLCAHIQACVHVHVVKVGSMFVYMCECIQVCLHMCMHVCVYGHVDGSAHVFVCMYVFICGYSEALVFHFSSLFFGQEL